MRGRERRRGKNNGRTRREGFERDGRTRRQGFERDGRTKKEGKRGRGGEKVRRRRGKNPDHLPFMRVETHPPQMEFWSRSN